MTNLEQSATSLFKVFLAFCASQQKHTAVATYTDIQVNHFLHSLKHRIYRGFCPFHDLSMWEVLS